MKAASTLNPGRSRAAKRAKDGSPLTLTITVDGDTAASLRAMAFVTGNTVEKTAEDALTGIDDRSNSAPELLREIFCWEMSEKERVCAVHRLRQYRDANGLDFPDRLIARSLLQEKIS